MAAIAVGQTLINTYRVERVLGQGPFGAVYMARHIRTGGLRAIKVIPKSVAAGEPYKKFLADSRIVATLRHPHIVPFIDYDRDETGRAFLVMDLLEGESLQQRLRRGNLPVPQALELIKEVGSALHAAHLAGVLHRGLKLENVFLVHHDLLDRVTEHAMVTDFGLGRLRKLLTPEGAQASLSPYLAPEAVNEKGQLDSRADQWSLGAIAYRLLGGSPPPLEVRAERLQQLAPEAPAAVVQAVVRALGRTREERFDTVLEFVRALAGAAVTEVVEGEATQKHVGPVFFGSVQSGVSGLRPISGVGMVAESDTHPGMTPLFSESGPTKVREFSGARPMAVIVSASEPGVTLEVSAEDLEEATSGQRPRMSAPVGLPGAMVPKHAPPVPSGRTAQSSGRVRGGKRGAPSGKNRGGVVEKAGAGSTVSLDSGGSKRPAPFSPAIVVPVGPPQAAEAPSVSISGSVMGHGARAEAQPASARSQVPPAGAIPVAPFQAPGRPEAAPPAPSSRSQVPPAPAPTNRATPPASPAVPVPASARSAVPVAAAPAPSNRSAVPVAAAPAPSNRSAVPSHITPGPSQRGGVPGAVSSGPSSRSAAPNGQSAPVSSGRSGSTPAPRSGRSSGLPERPIAPPASLDFGEGISTRRLAARAAQGQRTSLGFLLGGLLLAVLLGGGTTLLILRGMQRPIAETADAGSGVGALAMNGQPLGVGTSPVDVTPVATPIAAPDLALAVQAPPAGDKPVDKPVGEPPVGDKPVDKPVGEPPVADKPVDKPVGEPPTGDKPVGEPPTGDKPAVDKPTGDKPAVDKPVGEPPTGDKPAVDKPTSDKPAVAADPAADAAARRRRRSEGPKDELADIQRPKRAVNQDPEVVLREAQDAYMNGDARRAVTLALSVTQQPGSQGQAWRFIGTAACKLKDPRLAVRAFRSLKPDEQQLIIQMCARNGLVFEGGQFRVSE